MIDAGLVDRAQLGDCGMRVGRLQRRDVGRRQHEGGGSDRYTCYIGNGPDACGARQMWSGRAQLAATRNEENLWAPHRPRQARTSGQDADHSPDRPEHGDAADGIERR